MKFWMITLVYSRLAGLGVRYIICAKSKQGAIKLAKQDWEKWETEKKTPFVESAHEIEPDHSRIIHSESVILIGKN